MEEPNRKTGPVISPLEVADTEDLLEELAKRYKKFVIVGIDSGGRDGFFRYQKGDQHEVIGMLEMARVQMSCLTSLQFQQALVEDPEDDDEDDKDDTKEYEGP